MMEWLRSLFRPREAALLCMRLADMHVVHPDQIITICSSCGEEVGVYPSGQKVMREVPRVKVLCQVCRTPGEGAMLAPGAEHEPMQSVRRKL